MKRVVFLFVALIMGGSTGTKADDAAAPSRPNIVILLADDLGWRDVSFHGGEIATPHIDRIAAEGVQLNRFYVCPVCSPTRAALMTGRYPIRFGLMRTVVTPWRDFGLSTDEVTLADMLAKAGYEHRGVFGKWHLGHRRLKWHPLQRGFTHFRGHYNGNLDYFTHLREGERDWHVDYEPSDEEGYTTDLIGKAAAAVHPRACARRVSVLLLRTVQRTTQSAAGQADRSGEVRASASPARRTAAAARRHDRRPR